ncbi:hypothetical protein V491_09080, partial [Pseudogymnoascus sp. VKM F-3775]
MEKVPPPTPPHGDDSIPPAAFLLQKEKDLDIESASRSTSHEASRLDHPRLQNALHPVQSAHSAQISLSSVVPVDIRVRALG